MDMTEWITFGKNHAENQVSKNLEEALKNYRLLNSILNGYLEHEKPNTGWTLCFDKWSQRH